MSQQRIYGPKGLKTSSLCFGTMQFGGRANETDSAKMYASCREAGINFFDTAWVYTEGRSEEILGRLIAPERDEIVLVTKAGAEGGCSPKTIRSQLQESLTRMKLDYTDIFFLHRFDDNVPLEKTYEEVNALKQEGKFHHLGVSNYAAWQVMKAQVLAKTHGFPKIEILQPMYNLVKRQAEVEILPMAEAEDIGVISYSPLGGGLLTGKYNSTAPAEDAGRLGWDPKYTARYAQSWMHEAAARLQSLGADYGYSPISLAVAWVAAHSGVTAPIISARSAEQLRPSLASMDIKMDDQLYAKLSELAPTPPPATDRLEEQAS